MEYINKNALDKALTVAAASGKDKDKRTWVKAICMVHDMPTADVAPVVHGRWMDKGSMSCSCSECGCKTVKETKWCPNCGAKMDGGED